MYIVYAISEVHEITWLSVVQSVFNSFFCLNNITNNITVITLYATQAHGHKPYIKIHNTVINWKNPTYTYMSKQTEKNTTCTDRDTKIKVDYIS